MKRKGRQPRITWIYSPIFLSFMILIGRIFWWWNNLPRRVPSESIVTIFLRYLYGSHSNLSAYTMFYTASTNDDVGGVVCWLCAASTLHICIFNPHQTWFWSFHRCNIVCTQRAHGTSHSSAVCLRPLLLCRSDVGYRNSICKWHFVFW